MIHLPVLAVVAPLFYAFLMPMLDLVSKPARRGGVLLFASLQVVILLLLIPRVAAEGEFQYHVGGWGPRIGIVLTVDGLSLFFALLAAVGIWMVSLYSLDYVDRGDYRYFALLFIVLAGISGMLLTGDLFNMYVFFELASMASFPLIAFANSRGAVEAAFRYMLYSTVAAAFIVLAIGLIYGATGTLNLREAAAALSGADRLVRSVILGLLLVGFAIKTAIVPFHAWLPEAHSTAPAPISALLSGILLKTGVYAILRILFSFGVGTDIARLQLLLLNLGTLTVLVGHCLALGQRNFKRVLAYSSISHIGLIMAGVGLGTVAGLAGALFHSVNHMFMKSAAFLAVGNLGTGHGFETADMKGTGWRAPLAATAFVASALSLIGLPPFAGFIGKWEITIGALREAHVIHASAIAFGTLLSAIYYGRMARAVFSEADPRTASEDDIPGTNAGWLTGLVLVVAATGCLVPFLFWGTIEPVLIQIATVVRG